MNLLTLLFLLQKTLKRNLNRQSFFAKLVMSNVKDLELGLVSWLFFYDKLECYNTCLAGQ